MRKEIWSLSSKHVSDALRVARWGHFGTPVLLFPSAGGDFLEVERHGLIGAAESLITAGRIKLYSVDGVLARAWLVSGGEASELAPARAGFDALLAEEIVPHIRRDCLSDNIEMIAAGASLGASSALRCLCRRPEVFRAAVLLSGRFEAQDGAAGSTLPQLAKGAGAQKLRQRLIQLASGEGDLECPAQSARIEQLLGARGVPARLDLWGTSYGHGFQSWQEMLPRYLAALA
jgi:esterase/lipase superfamily enzyme